MGADKSGSAGNKYVHFSYNMSFSENGKVPFLLCRRPIFAVMAEKPFFRSGLGAPSLVPHSLSLSSPIFLPCCMGEIWEKYGRTGGERAKLQLVGWFVSGHILWHYGRFVLEMGRFLVTEWHRKGFGVEFETKLLTVEKVCGCCRPYTSVNRTIVEQNKN